MNDPSGRRSAICSGLACHIGAITGRGCAGNDPCPLVVLAERGVIVFPATGDARSFDDAFAEFNLTSDERKALAWHLVAVRGQALLKRLLPNGV